MINDRRIIANAV